MVAKNAEGENKVEAMLEVLMPDLFDSDVEVTQVLVRPGAVIEKEQALITVESDKASMEIPSPAAGTVCEMKVKLGDKLSKGAPILTIQTDHGEPANQAARKWLVKATGAFYQKTLQASEVATMVAKNARGENKVEAMYEVLMPDISDFKDVEVTAILVRPGDVVSTEQALITVESDIAWMEIPSPAAGTVREMKVKPGDKVFKGMPILTIKLGQGAPANKAPAVAAPPNVARAAVAPPAAAVPARVAPAPVQVPVTPANEAALNWLKKATSVFYQKPQARAQVQDQIASPSGGFRRLRLEFIVVSPRGRAGQPIDEVPAVRLTAGGRPLAGAEIEFRVSQGDLDGATTARSPTNAHGIARVRAWTLGAAGDHSISAEFRSLREERIVRVS